MAYAASYSSDAFATDLVGLFTHQLTASALKPGESCIAITDTSWNPALAAACVAAATGLGANSFQAMFAWNAEPEPRALEALCDAADLIVYCTAQRLHYRPEIAAFLARGGRVLCCMEPPHVLSRLRADPEVRRRALAGAKRLDTGSRIHITSPAGTDLVMDKSGRAALANYGAADTPGHLDFWGLGAVQSAQLETATDGTLILDVGDCCFYLGRFIECPVTIRFEAGRVVAIEGGLDASLIRAELEAAGDDTAFRAGHMAWGVDRRARWTQAITQTPTTGGGGADSESFYGIVQVELGSNDDVGFRGINRSRAHLGLCLRNASLSLDGTPVIDHGTFLPSDLV
jgi:2,5-dihydroxypyridine 5,6-dioxygenase